MELHPRDSVRMLRPDSEPLPPELVHAYAPPPPSALSSSLQVPQPQGLSSVLFLDHGNLGPWCLVPAWSPPARPLLHPHTVPADASASFTLVTDADTSGKSPLTIPLQSARPLCTSTALFPRSPRHNLQLYLWLCHYDPSPSTG